MNSGADCKPIGPLEPFEPCPCPTSSCASFGAVAGVRAPRIVAARDVRRLEFARIGQLMPDKNSQAKTLETVAGWLLIALGALSLLFVRDFVSAALMIAVGVLVLRRMWRLFATIVGGVGAARSLLILLPGSIAIAREWGDLTYLLHALLSLAAFGLAVGVLMWPRETVPLPRFQRPAKLDDNNWREWLLASLQDVGAEPVRDRFPILALAVFGVIALSAVLVFASPPPKSGSPERSAGSAR